MHSIIQDPKIYYMKSHNLINFSNMVSIKNPLPFFGFSLQTTRARNIQFPQINIVPPVYKSYVNEVTLIEQTFSWDLQLWQIVTLQPFDLQTQYLQH